MKNINKIVLITVCMLIINASCTKPTTQNITKKDTQTNIQIKQVKDFFEKIRNNKKTRSSIILSDDSLVYYIEADLNIELGDFKYDRDVITTEIVDVTVPHNNNKFDSDDIDDACQSIKSAILNKYNSLNTSANPGLVVLYVDVEITESTSTHKKIRGTGVMGVNVTPIPLHTDRYYRCWPFYYPSCPTAIRGYCSDYYDGKRVSDIYNTNPGYMTLRGKQLYLDYAFPNGIPQMYQYIAINIQNVVPLPSAIASNPYRPSMLKNQYEGYTSNVCFYVDELDFYMGLSNARITYEVSNLNKSYLNHYWTHKPPPYSPPNTDYSYILDEIKIYCGDLVLLNQ
ncbi:MAG TPA: hypothetical protein PKC41_08350 [Chitinophagaceae bacterium]|jgi:hypothetical protein|nr:hypothetical protein [Chitinophagaceae bacterium]